MAIKAISFAWRSYKHDAVTRGIDFNRKAWEISYTDRGLSIPPSGPREGYWGSRIGKKIRDPRLGWHEPQKHIPGLLEIDKNGHQHYKTSGPRKYNILIFGGSVAFGAYASKISRTYFHIIGSMLDRNLLFSDITVIAAGAWKSIQEVEALENYDKKNHFDLAIFLNGLNDLTNGATSRTLYGEEIKPADGSPWTLLYHALDYEQRVSDYLANMDVARQISKNSGSDMLVVLQPTLVERQHLTKIEKTLLKGSLKSRGSPCVYDNCYAEIRNGLRQRTQNEGFHFLDCSRIFAGEKATTFADLWHFSDFGHQLLGNAMARKISGILKQRNTNYDVSRPPNTVGHAP